MASIQTLKSILTVSSSGRAKKSREDGFTKYPVGLQPHTQTLVECLKSITSPRYLSKEVPTCTKKSSKTKTHRTLSVSSAENSIRLASPSNSIKIVSVTAVNNKHKQIVEQRTSMTSAKKQQPSKLRYNGGGIIHL